MGVITSTGVSGWAPRMTSKNGAYAWASESTVGIVLGKIQHITEGMNAGHGASQLGLTHAIPRKAEIDEVQIEHPAQELPDSSCPGRLAQPPCVIDVP